MKLSAGISGGEEGIRTEPWRQAIEIRRLAARGVTKTKIAQRLRVKVNMVYRIRKAARVSLPEKFAPQVQALHAQGLSKAAIGRELNVCQETISKAFKINGVRPVRIPLHPDRQRALHVLELVAAGMEKREICRKLGTTEETIRRVVRRAEAGQVVTIRRNTRIDPKRVRQLFKSGVAVSTIARRLRICENTVRAILDIGAPIPFETAARIRELALAGVSKTRIVKQLKIRLSDVHRVLPPAHYLARANPTTAKGSKRHSKPTRLRRAVTIKVFAEQHGFDIDDVRSAIGNGTLTSSKIGKTVLIPSTESARLLREAYLKLSVAGGGQRKRSKI